MEMSVDYKGYIWLNNNCTERIENEYVEVIFNVLSHYNTAYYP